MRVRPDFFRWSTIERDRYRTNIPEHDVSEIDRLVQKELFGFTKARGELDETQLDRLNATILPLRGIGEDCFYLNEWLGEDMTILDFETLRDYDHHDHLFQEEGRKTDSPDYLVKPYRGSLYFAWARLFFDGRLAYADLSMAAGYLLSEIEEHAREIVEALIPHRYVPGKDHGKRVEGGYSWDMRVDAEGQESLLEELQDFSYAGTRRRHEELADLWDRDAAKGVFIFERDIAGESNKHFVFTDKRALEVIRFRSFLRDCRAIERPFAELNAQAGRERSDVESQLRAEHARLLEEFDPTVVKLRKKRKVIVRKDAADKLF
jgi:hypothetical protein